MPFSTLNSPNRRSTVFTAAHITDAAPFHFRTDRPVAIYGAREHASHLRNHYAQSSIGAIQRESACPISKVGVDQRRMNGTAPNRKEVENLAKSYFGSRSTAYRISFACAGLLRRSWHNHPIIFDGRAQRFHEQPYQSYGERNDKGQN